MVLMTQAQGRSEMWRRSSRIVLCMRRNCSAWVRRYTSRAVGDCRWSNFANGARVIASDLRASASLVLAGLLARMRR